MSCITCYPPSIASTVTFSKSKQHFNSIKSFWPSRLSKANWLLQWRNRTDGSFTFTTRAAPPAALFIAATSPPNSGDFSVLFQTSAVMLFVYWIANFVVPEFVMKNLQADEANADAKEEDQNPSVNNGQGSTPRRTASSGTKKKGFGTTRK